MMEHRIATEDSGDAEQPGNQLTLLENATRMLSEVSSAPEAKKLMDMAAAAEHYARKAKLGEEAVHYAREIKTDAEAMLGEFLATAKKHPAGRPKAEIGRPGRPISDTPTIADLGLSKDESANAQKLAKLKRNDPAKYADIRAGKASKKKALRPSTTSPSHKPEPSPPPQKAADPTPPSAEPLPKLDSQPWVRPYNELLADVVDAVDALKEKFELLIALDGTDKAFSEWIDVKQWRLTFKEMRMRIEHQRVMRWATQKEKTRLSRPFVYEIDEKKKVVG